MKRSLRPRATAEFSELLNRQLNMYALAAGATGAGLLALAQPAEAKIIYTPAHAKVDFGRPVALDLNHDGIVDFYLNIAAEYGLARLEACQFLASGTHGPFCTSMAGTNAGRVTTTFFAAALRYGAKIQRGDRFVSGSFGLGGYANNGTSITWYGPWMNAGKGVKNRYLGLKFKINGRFQFGWVRITVPTTSNSFTAILTGYAYETIPGKGIVAGKTKGPDVTTVDPASLGHLAAGASAMPAWRRGKQAAANTH